MSLSTEARTRLKVALTDETVGKEVADAIDAGANPAGYTLPAATAEVIGGVKLAASVAEAAGANPTAAEFKALLDSLIAAGVLASAA